LVKNKDKILGASPPKSECECQDPCSFPTELIPFFYDKKFETMLLKSMILITKKKSYKLWKILLLVKNRIQIQGASPPKK
jgi:hypothetical protein